MHEARAAVAETQSLLQDVRLRAVRDVQTAIEGIVAALDFLNLQNENIKYAQQNRDLTTKSYEAGQAPLVRLNEAQKDLVAAQVRRTQAIISLRQTRNDFETATGQILEYAE